MPTDLYINSRITIPGFDLSWTAVRASGPGGQNVNKVATKVVLRFDMRTCLALPPRVKARLKNLAGSRLDQSGHITVASQVTRNRIRNLEDARRKLAELIAAAAHEPKRRVATRPSRGVHRRRIKAKRQRSELKRTRRKPVED